jgi:hypothetical protein
MKCSNCSKEVPENAKVCGYCGTKLEIKQEHICPDCGKEIPAKAKVCGFCGSKLVKPSIKTHKTDSPPAKEKSSKSADHSLKGKPKWGMIGGIVVILLIAVILIWVFTMRPSSENDSPSQPAVVESESVPFSSATGNWVATDTDGSTMQLKISQNGGNTFTIVLIDDGTSSCGSDSSGNLLSFIGQGTDTSHGYTLKIDEVVGTCAETEEELIYDETLTYNPEADTLVDIYDVTWHRK